MLTKQEIFTKVYETLRERGFTRAGITLRYEDGEEVFSCRYRSPVGPCAIGIFITDEEYDSTLEHKEADEAITGMCAALRKPLGEYGWAFFSLLQATHDEGHTPELMEAELRLFAQDHGLEVPE